LGDLSICIGDDFPLGMLRVATVRTGVTMGRGHGHGNEVVLRLSADVRQGMVLVSWPRPIMSKDAGVFFGFTVGEGSLTLRGRM